MSLPTFKPVADHALLIEFATEVSDDINRLVIALDQAITQAAILGVTEVIPAMVNLLVIFDPTDTDHSEVQIAVTALLPTENKQLTSGQLHEVDVCYEPDFSPDLNAVAQACNLSSEAVINAHLSASYRVSMYGFAPGYAYLSGVPQAIQVPRKPAPLRDIPAGSILIAGAQCLATTLIMPTGWSIIGRTSTNVMTDDEQHPFLFDVGDTIKFNRVDHAHLAKDLA